MAGQDEVVNPSPLTRLRFAVAVDKHHAVAVGVPPVWVGAGLTPPSSWTGRVRGRAAGHFP
eukprot:10067858-Lingulodinium_polyedra.AAC.1